MADKMMEMLAEACKIALGKEWDTMTAQEQHDTIMSFIATAAHEERIRKEA